MQGNITKQTIALLSSSHCQCLQSPKELKPQYQASQPKACLVAKRSCQVRRAVQSKIEKSEPSTRTSHLVVMRRHVRGVWKYRMWCDYMTVYRSIFVLFTSECAIFARQSGSQEQHCPTYIGRTFFPIREM